MNKAQLVAAMAENAGMTKKDAEKALAAFEEVVTTSLQKGEKIQLVGFGTFEVVNRPARTGINPQTKESITIEASNTPKFKPGKALKDAVDC